MKDQEVIDLGWEEYVESLKDNYTYVDVGVLAQDGSMKDEKSDITLIEKATFNEFGTEHIPPRPFIRQTFDENEDELTALAVKLDTQILQEKITRKKALDMLGQTHQNQIQSNMVTRGAFEENAEITKIKKGSDMPLVDTGQLRQSISFEVG